MIYTSGTTGRPKSAARSTEFVNKPGVLSHLFTTISFLKCGKAFADNELRIIDEFGNDLPDGERGMLYVYNAIMMDGYYKNDKVTHW